MNRESALIAKAVRHPELESAQRSDFEDADKSLLEKKNCLSVEPDSLGSEKRDDTKLTEPSVVGRL